MVLLLILFLGYSKIISLKKRQKGRTLVANDVQLGQQIGLFPVSRPTLFFGAYPKLFFSTFKRRFKIREEKWRKIIKIRLTVQKLQAIAEILKKRTVIF